MKTTGQDANPKPGRECSTCGTPLLRDEYELCDQCRAELMEDYNERYSEPQDEWEKGESW